MSQFIEMFGSPENNHKDYPIIKIGDMVESINYGTSKPANDNGKYVYLRMNNITYDGKLDLSEVKRIDLSLEDDESAFVHKGDLMFNRTNTKEFVGKTTVFNLDEPMVVAGYIIRVRFKDIITPEYVSGYLNSTYGKALLRKMAKGAVHQANINAQEFQGIRILDVPKHEQNKFVTILQQADKSEFDGFKSQFIEMFGDPITNPKSWPVMSMKESSVLLSDGPFGSNLKTEHYCEEGIRVIRLQNICLGYFDDTDKAYVSVAHYEKLKKYTCKPGEIVIGTLGEPNFRACIIPSYIELSINKADCVHYIPKVNLLNNIFACAYINCERTLQMATSNIHGTTRARIAAGQVNSIPIYIPPMDIQKQFVAIAEQADKSENRCELRIAS